MKRITWGSPVKSFWKAQKKLKEDLKFYGAGGRGDCAMLELRHPQIEAKVHRDGSTWWHIMVDDVALPLAEHKWIPALRR